jgi:hypothetical protein
MLVVVLGIGESRPKVTRDWPVSFFQLCCRVDDCMARRHSVIVTLAAAK